MLYEKSCSHWFFRHKYVALEYLSILAIDLVILLNMEIQNAVLKEHFYLSPTL